MATGRGGVHGLILVAVTLLAALALLAGCGGGGSSGGGGDDSGDTGGCEVGDQGCGNAVFDTFDLAMGGAVDAITNASNPVEDYPYDVCTSGNLYVSGTWETGDPETVIDFALGFNACRFVVGETTDLTFDGEVTISGEITDDVTWDVALASDGLSVSGEAGGIPVNFSCAFAMSHMMVDSSPTYSVTVCGTELY